MKRGTAKKVAAAAAAADCTNACAHERQGDPAPGATEAPAPPRATTEELLRLKLAASERRGAVLALTAAMHQTPEYAAVVATTSAFEQLCEAVATKYGVPRPLSIDWNDGSLTTQAPPTTAPAG